MKLDRIAIVGPSGAGKSTLARRLGQMLDLPVVHLDTIYWNAGWIATPGNLWRDKLTRVIQNTPCWIIDGNFESTYDLRLPLADMIIYLDFPRWRCMGRIFKRWMRYRGKTRPDLPDGCPEQLDWEFVEWVWNFNDDVRPRMLQALPRYARGKHLVILRTPEEVDQFIIDLEQTCRAPQSEKL
jgi:adenylate kinase family enzyme